MRGSAAEILDGQITIERGTSADYRGLAHFHYAPGRPATWAGVWRGVYWEEERRRHCKLQIEDCKLQIEKPKSGRVVAVGVLSFPVLSLRQRERALGLEGMEPRQRREWVNRHIRTISRVIVHPQFRALGLASALVRRICADCTVRYVEALAAMGDVHPFFEKGGMRRVTPPGSDQPAYFILDREG
jgi:hypothetical protein